MNYKMFLEQCEKVDELAKQITELNEQLDHENRKLDSYLFRLDLQATEYGYALHHGQDGTYYWTNSHKQYATYPTLLDAVKAYIDENIDFG